MTANREIDDANGMPDVTAVITTFNSGEVIRSVLEAVPEDSRVIVVDNASRDNTIDLTLKTRPDAKVIALKSNVGFGRASNIGLLAVQSEFALLLNPDVEFQPEGVKMLLGAARARQDLSVLGVPSSYAPIYDDAEPVRDVEFVEGSCMLFRMKDFKDSKIFDENFFLYFEDSDLCVRLRAMGRRLGAVPAARIIHKGNKSTAARFDNSLEKAWLWGAACAYFADKNRDHVEGRNARRKLIHYRKKRMLANFTGDRRAQLEMTARLRGAASVREHGPGIMFDNLFSGGTWRTEDLAEELAG